ncbi:unnamed protein product, partial [Ixodes persulcatus]
MANTVAAALPAHSLASMLFSGGDPRVRHWALMGSPAVIVSILAGYLYFSLRLGPALMKNRRPFHIRPLVVTYNVVMVMLSVYFLVLTLKLTYLRGSGAYSLFCQGTDGGSTAMPLLYHGWFYMLMKVGELLDTVFFVLLKKNGHISFLHLLHHSVALSTVWLDINNGITGQVAMFPILNTAVHMCLSLRTGSCTSPSVAVIAKPTVRLSQAAAKVVVADSSGNRALCSLRHRPFAAGFWAKEGDWPLSALPGPTGSREPPRNAHRRTSPATRSTGTPSSQEGARMLPNLSRQ